MLKNETPDEAGDNWVDLSSDAESKFQSDEEAIQLKKMENKQYYKVMKAEFGCEDIKMVFIVRSDLSMGKGKIGAQCGHATLGVYLKTKLWAKHCKYWAQVLKKWSNEGQKKICLKVNSQPDM